jgi:hypothetical protein
MMIINAPDASFIGTNTNNVNNNSLSSINNLPGGEYTVIFFPRYSARSSQIINGKTISSYPVNTACLPVRTITLPVYVRPVIDIPMSGGISCTTGTTNMTITVGQGSKPPFTYRYKVKGAPDASYIPQAFQASNVFNNIAPGDYTIQVRDNCGSITTQDVHVFDGTEQFVGIVGEVAPGIVCETREVILSVLSIGPVQWYEWYYCATSSTGPWTPIGNNTHPGSPTYTIPFATQADKGYYKVVIHNGLCQLESQVHIIDVLPPAGTPYITGSNYFCAGNNTTLTAHTTLPSVIYQWYKNGVPIDGASSSTYTTNEIGTYTVIVTPYQGCPSDPSAPHTLSEQIVVSPDASILSALPVCSGSNPVIHLSTSLNGVTYKVYTASSGGTVVGTGTGTGAAIDITLTTTPTGNITY